MNQKNLDLLIKACDEIVAAKEAIANAVRQNLSQKRENNNEKICFDIFCNL